MLDVLCLIFILYCFNLFLFIPSVFVTNKVVYNLRHNLRRALQIDSTGSRRSEMIVDRWRTVYDTTRRPVASASL